MFNAKNKNKGQVLVLVALSLVVFLGFAALAIDVAYFYHTKHQLQGAADAAALAGASMISCKADSGGIRLEEEARQNAWTLGCKNKAAGNNVYLITNDPSNCDTPPAAANLNGANDPDKDIVIGIWDGSNFIRADGNTGRRINAVKVTARRTGETPGMASVSTFFGKIFGIDTVNIKATAVAEGCQDFGPIAVNEYWMGDDPIGGGACAVTTRSDTGRKPWGRNHVYPNSFVRPPCTTPGASNCSDPANGNVLTTAAPAFKAFDCMSTLLIPPVTANGPLSVDCSGAECLGRPPGKPRASRIFAVVGGNAAPNNVGGNMYGLLNLDERIGSSNETGPYQQWYLVSGNSFTPEPNADPNSKKGTLSEYIRSGKYPNVLPTYVTEVYQTGYVSTTVYDSHEPYASVSFINGVGVTGQEVNDNYYDSGNYSDGKYGPGKKIIVAVYDGIIGAGFAAGQERTTIVGYAKVTIYGYGNRINPVTLEVTGPENTMYGYIENANDFKLNIEDLLKPGDARLVQ